MKGKFSAVLVTLLMLASMPSFLAGGSDISFTNLEEGDVLTTKVYNVQGNAMAVPDAWIQNTSEEFEQGIFKNTTLTQDGNIILEPFLSVLQKDTNNPVLDLGGNWSYNEYGTIVGEVIKDGSTYKMWNIGINRSYGYNVGYHTSTDGKTWTSQNTTLMPGPPGSWDEYVVWPSCVLKEGSTFKMWYTGVDFAGDFWRIGYATSTNGVDWTKGNGGQPVFDVGPINKFDGGGVAFPSIIKEDSTYTMFYAGLISYSGNLFQMGIATSSNGIDWTRGNDGEPVLSFGKTNAFDMDGIYNIDVVKDGPVYRCWYLGMPSFKMGYATSRDGAIWVKENDAQPVLTSGGSGTFDENSIEGLSVLKDGMDIKLFYTGSDAMWYYRIGMAKANLKGLTGSYESIFYDAELVASWGGVDLIYDEPTGTTIRFETRSSDDKVHWTHWMPLENGTNGWSDSQYMQYRILMTSTDGIALPTLSECKLIYEAIERVEVSLDNSTWYIAEGTTTWNISLVLKEGKNTIYVRAVDTHEIPTYTKLALVVDTIKPTGIMQIDGDAKYTTDTSVDLTLSGVDAQGMVKMQLSTNENMTGAEWQEFNTSLEGFEIPAIDGTVTIYAQLMDTTGLVSNVFTDSIILDTTPPNGTVQIRDGAPMTVFKTNVLKLYATDANGVVEMRVSGTPDFADADWDQYSTTSEWTVEGDDGVNTVYVEFKDGAGLTKVVNDTIVLDTEKPTGTIVINDGEELATSKQVTITLDAEDENGVSHVLLSNDANFITGIWQSHNETLSWTLGDLLGEVTVYAKFKDSAGLESEPVTDTIILDIHEEGFEGQIEINDGNIYANSRILTVGSIFIGDIGGSQMMLSEKSDFSGASWQAYAQTTIYTVNASDGELTIYAKFMDKFGLETEVAMDTIILDTTEPTVSISYPTPGKKIKKSPVEIEGVASDNIDLATVEVQLRNGQWVPVDTPENFTFELDLVDKGEQTINIRATDGAGNVKETSVTIKYNPADDTTPGFEGTALLIGIILVVLLFSRRRASRV
jgi:hypothetical protein